MLISLFLRFDTILQTYYITQTSMKTSSVPLRSVALWSRCLLPFFIALVMPVAARAQFPTLEILKHEWGVSEFKVITTLSSTDGNTYTGQLSTTENYTGIILRYDGNIYQPKTQISINDGEISSNAYDFNITSDFPWAYMTFTNKVSYAVTAKVSGSNTISLYFGDAPITGPTDPTDPTDPEKPDIPSPAVSSTIPASVLAWKSGESYSPDEANTIWYNPTSLDWTHSCDDQHSADLHLGNGHLGMTVLGTPFETFMINEKTYFEGKRPSSYDASANIGQYMKAGGLYNGLIGIGDYKFLSQLDLIDGVATACVYPNSGSPIYKEFFTSRPDDVFAYHITSASTFGMEFGVNELKQKSISAEGSEGYIVSTGTLSTVSATFVLKVVAAGDGATVKADASKLTVTGTTDLLVLLGCVSDYDIDEETYVNTSRDCESEARSIVDNASAKGWEALYDAHVADHSALMGACMLNLSENNAMPTDELLAAYRDGSASQSERLMLEQLIFQYGRYKMVGSSRKGDRLPNNLRGLWMAAQRWNGDIHADLNIEMNYWPIENTNLSDCHMPFLDYITTMAGKTEWKSYAAHRAPGCASDSWTLDNANNIFGAAQMYISTYSEANAWFCYHLWQHYLYTLDKDYLAGVLPAMIGACHFWMQKMTWDDELGKWICPEVWSPENQTGGNTAVHARQMVWELFRNTIEAIGITGTHADELTVLSEKFKDIDPGLHVENGALQEWHRTSPSEDGHRHFSHLMCLYPMAQVSPYDEDRTNFEAAVGALDLRGDGDGGEACDWQKSWHMAMRARALGHGDYGDERGPHHQLELGVNYLYKNLNAATAGVHQIDGNSGLTAGMAECLLQSYSGVIDILPALPSEWSDGNFSGMKAQGNFEVDCEWEEGLLKEVRVRDCLNHAAMRSGVRLRFHNMEANGVAMIKDLYVNGVKVAEAGSMAPAAVAAAAKPVYEYEPVTDTYLVSIPAGSPALVTANFTGDNSGTSTGIGEISVSGNDSPVEYFDLQGRRVAEPACGIYIRRCGSDVRKVIVR